MPVIEQYVPKQRLTFVIWSKRFIPTAKSKIEDRSRSIQQSLSNSYLIDKDVTDAVE